MMWWPAKLAFVVATLLGVIVGAPDDECWQRGRREAKRRLAFELAERAPRWQRQLAAGTPIVVDEMCAGTHESFTLDVVAAGDESVVCLTAPNEHANEMCKALGIKCDKSRRFRGANGALIDGNFLGTSLFEGTGAWTLEKGKKAEQVHCLTQVGVFHLAAVLHNEQSKHVFQRKAALPVDRDQRQRVAAIVADAKARGDPFLLGAADAYIAAFDEATCVHEASSAPPTAAQVVDALGRLSSSDRRRVLRDAQLHETLVDAAASQHLVVDAFGRLNTNEQRRAVGDVLAMLNGNDQRRVLEDRRFRQQVIDVATSESLVERTASKINTDHGGFEIEDLDVDEGAAAVDKCPVIKSLADLKTIAT